MHHCPAAAHQMQKYWKKAMLLSIILVLSGLLAFSTWDLVTLEGLKENGAALSAYVDAHYLLAVAAFGAAFLSTAFFVPGAIILTISGGFLFGAVRGAIYSSLFSTIASTVAFLVSRYVIGEWVQSRFHLQLVRFNEEIHRHGTNYLFVLRIVPVMPAFLINYLSGLTRIPTVRFMVVSFFGICPGAAVYSLAGSQLATLETAEDVMSPDVLIGLLLLALLALAPVLYRRIGRAIKGSK